MHTIKYIHGWTRLSRKEFFHKTLQFYVNMNIRKSRGKDLYFIDIGYSSKSRRRLSFSDCDVKLIGVASYSLGTFNRVLDEVERKYVLQNIVELTFLTEIEREKLIDTI